MLKKQFLSILMLFYSPLLLFYSSFVFGEKTLSCEIQGGLGNQLFQIATTLATAWDHDYAPIFPRLSNSPSFLSPRPVYWSTLFTQLPTQQEHAFDHFLRYIELKDTFSPIALEGSSIKLVGYWQSPKYFDHHRDRILSFIQPIPSLADDIEQRFQVLVQKHTGSVVSMHLRRGDYMLLDDFMCLWQERYKQYYLKAVSYFPEETLFMVFSDDPAYAKHFFYSNFPTCKAVFPKEEDYVELYLMAKCDHAIIANSTFSWWGAYLNTNSHKIVISPKEWTVTHSQGVYRPDFLPSDWITISVFK